MTVLFLVSLLASGLFFGGLYAIYYFAFDRPMAKAIKDVLDGLDRLEALVARKEKHDG